MSFDLQVREIPEIKAVQQANGIQNLIDAVKCEQIKAVEIFEAVKVESQKIDYLADQVEQTHLRINATDDRIKRLRANAINNRKEIEKLTKQFKILNEIIEEIK